MNKITIIGNVGHTPEIKTVGDTKVAVFSIADTERGYTKRDGTKVEDKTEWFSCEAWRGHAELVEKYVKKGDKLYIEGRYTTRKYKGNDGLEKTACEVRVSAIELLTPKPSQQSAPVMNQPAVQPAPAQVKDDLPF